MATFVRLTRVDYQDHTSTVWLNADTIARLELAEAGCTRIVFADLQTAMTVTESPDQVLAFLTGQPVRGEDCELCGKPSVRGELHRACEEALADAPKVCW
ncbi:MAG TPA: hypothetical protein VGJ60_16590 [Chloroflexota bacterium]|jgi:hypothetical protein